ncbi:MAG TPA: GSCFA domain-containing protein [Puia sp.]|nr:GSCFA domain-containing protein [Puia sp.]
MEFQLPITIPSLPNPIQYGERILLTGSCFTEHIGNALTDWKFLTFQNPNGILFDPASVASSLVSYIGPKHYGKEDLLFLNDLWQSWQHHSIFSHPDPAECLRGINAAQEKAHDFLHEADWLIITLGTAWSYRLVDGNRAVANCHRAPGQWFHKHLMTIGEIQAALDGCLHQLWQFNPRLRILFTISPVRHIRDGVVENNRSKARLIEAVHQLVGKWERLFYFPAYELVIDVLRDYRFYDIDMVHPNYPATTFVLEKFVRHCIDEPARQLLEEVKKIMTARRHRPLQPTTPAHRRFLQEHFQKTAELARQHPFLDFSEELRYFSAEPSGK